jgi:hypothetical protein
MIQEINGGGWNLVTKRPLELHREQAPTGDTTSVAAASATRTVDASLSITTKEGDTVSITADFDMTATYASLRGHGGRASAWNASSTSQVSVQVQGDLSEQEMKDISRVVKTFLHDLRAMLKGRDVSVANVANGDPETLQSVSASAQTSTTITAVAASLTTGSPEVAMQRPHPRNLAGSEREHGWEGAPRGMALPLPSPATFTPTILTPTADSAEPVPVLATA